MGCTVTTIHKDVNLSTTNQTDKTGPVSNTEAGATSVHNHHDTLSRQSHDLSWSSMSSFASKNSRSSRRRRRSSSSSSSASVWSRMIDAKAKFHEQKRTTKKTCQLKNEEITIDVDGIEFDYDANPDLSSTRSPRVIRVAGTDHVAVVCASAKEQKDFSGGDDDEEEIVVVEIPPPCPTHQCGEREESGFDWMPPSCWIAADEFAQVFELEDRLGKGSTCSVVRAMKKRCGTTRMCAQSAHAVKQVARPKKRSSVRREVTILSQCSHPNIVRLDGVSVGPKSFYIVTELCTGGTIIDYMKGRDGVGEDEARRITMQLLSAVQYLHSNGMIHRDIKPDNIVFEDSSRARVVLIDFGSARELSAMKEVVHDWAGTPAYMAPEMVSNRTREDSKAVDMWALGVTTYVMLTGYLPFFGPNVKALMTEVRRKRLVYPRGITISRESTRFVGSLLRKRISRRMTVGEALEHEWITGRTDNSRVLPSATSGSSSDSSV